MSYIKRIQEALEEDVGSTFFNCEEEMLDYVEDREQVRKAFEIALLSKTEINEFKFYSAKNLNEAKTIAKKLVDF